MSSEQQSPFSHLTPTRDLRAINAALQQLRSDTKNPVHLIGPGVRSLNRLEHIPENFHVVWHVFLFDPTVGGPHVYHDNSWKGDVVALKRDALLELWMSADGRHMLTERMDDRSQPNYAEYKWTGAALGLNGMPIPYASSHQLDLRDGSADYEGMVGGEKKNWKQLQGARSKIAQLCESKAQNRVIRSILGIQQNYPAAQMAWPFVLMKIVFMPDMKDPITRGLVTMNALGMSNAVFGTGGAAGAELMRQLLGASAQRDEENNRQLTAGTPQAALPAAAPVEEASDFEVEAAAPAQVAQINTLADYEQLEATCNLQTGEATPAMLAALEDLKTRNPNNKQINLKNPFTSWKAASRRVFVERMLKKD